MAERFEWQLDPAEVEESSMGSRSGGRRRLRGSRTLDRSSMRLTLKHLPTGVEVAGEVPDGNYSRSELRDKVGSLRSQLFRMLEREVGRRLRIPGR